MTRAPSLCSRRIAAATFSCRMNTLLRAGLGGALLALAACSGDMDAGSDGSEGELEDPGSEVVDVLDSTAVPQLAGVIEKATFDDNATYNGFSVRCTPEQKALINAAEARAREVLAIAMPANANARVNRTTQKAQTFQIYFLPDGDTNPDPNRTSPDAWDTASSRVGQKMAKVSEVLTSPIHTCHGGDESIINDGTFRTCNQTLANAATNSEATGGLAANTVRWCERGLAGSPNARAVTLLHELTHQDRTNDSTEGHVFDDDRAGRLYDAQNWSNWYNNNQQP
jgi:hypothetical protein